MLSSTLPTNPVLPRISSFRPRKTSDGDSTGAAAAAPVETSSIGPASIAPGHGFPPGASFQCLVAARQCLVAARVGARTATGHGRAGALPVADVACHARIGAGGVAADAADAETGRAIPRELASWALLDVAATGALAVAVDAVGVVRARALAGVGGGVAPVGNADDGRSGAAVAPAVAHHLAEDGVPVARAGAADRAEDALAAGARAVARAVVAARQCDLHRASAGRLRGRARGDRDARADGAGQVTAMAAVGTVGVAADAVGAEAGHALAAGHARRAILF